MFYRILADAVVLFHLAFILFVVAGGLLAWRRKFFILLHLPAAIWGAYVEFTGTICPLTPLEIHFSQLAGGQGYSSGFIEQYLVPIIYPAALTRELQLFLGGGVVFINIVLYAFLVRKYWRAGRI